MLKRLHDTPVSGHLGVSKSLGKVCEINVHQGDLHLPHGDLENQNYAEDTHSLSSSVEIAQDFASDHQQISSQRMKRCYNTLSVPSILRRGAMVWLHSPQRKKGLSPKLSRPWEGLYVVLERINDAVYRIKRSPRARPNVVHRNRLWTYRGTTRAY